MRIETFMMVMCAFIGAALVLLMILGYDVGRQHARIVRLEEEVAALRVSHDSLADAVSSGACDRLLGWLSAWGRANCNSGEGEDCLTEADAK